MQTAVGKKKDQVQAYLMLLPMVAGFALFTLYPMFWLIRWSWFDYNGISVAKFIGAENFIRVFERDPHYWKALANTFYIVGIKLIIEIPLALCLAAVLNRASKINAVFRTVFFMPSIVSTAIVGLVFFLMFEPFQGVVNLLLKQTGMISANINWFSNKWLADGVIIMASIWKGFGTNMIFFLMGLQSIPKELYECASLDGASRWEQFTKITLPMLSSIMKVVIMLAIISSMKMSDLVLVLTNGQPSGGTEVVMSYTFKYFFSYGAVDATSQYGYAAALAVVTGVVLGLITLIYFRLTKNVGDMD